VEADNKKLQSFIYLKKKRNCREVSERSAKSVVCLDEGEEMSIIRYNENAAPNVKYLTCEGITRP
jgi:hypothetical protein